MTIGQKARVWDGEKMHYPEQGKISPFVLTQDGEIWNSDNSPISEADAKKMIWMPCLGWKDLTGREVYVGDIVCWNDGTGHNTISIGEFTHYTGEYQDEEETLKAICMRSGKGFQYSISKEELAKMRVVGNIYEK